MCVAIVALTITFQKRNAWLNDYRKITLKKRKRKKKKKKKKKEEEESYEKSNCCLKRIKKTINAMRGRKDEEENYAPVRVSGFQFRATADRGTFMYAQAGVS